MSLIGYCMRFFDCCRKKENVQVGIEPTCSKNFEIHCPDNSKVIGIDRVMKIKATPDDQSNTYR